MSGGVPAKTRSSRGTALLTRELGIRGRVDLLPYRVKPQRLSGIHTGDSFLDEADLTLSGSSLNRLQGSVSRLGKSATPSSRLLTRSLVRFKRTTFLEKRISGNSITIIVRTCMPPPQQNVNIFLDPIALLRKVFFGIDLDESEIKYFLTVAKVWINKKDTTFKGITRDQQLRDAFQKIEDRAVMLCPAIGDIVNNEQRVITAIAYLHLRQFIGDREHFFRELGKIQLGNESSQMRELIERSKKLLGSNHQDFIDLLTSWHEKLPWLTDLLYQIEVNERLRIQSSLASEPHFFVSAGNFGEHATAIGSPNTATTIGRSSLNTLQILARSASKRHAKLFISDGEVWIEDLNSHNGTCVNGKRINRMKLSEEDRIQIGKINISIFLYKTFDAQKVFLWREAIYVDVQASTEQPQEKAAAAATHTYQSFQLLAEPRILSDPEMRVITERVLAQTEAQQAFFRRGDQVLDELMQAIENSDSDKIIALHRKTIEYAESLEEIGIRLQAGILKARATVALKMAGLQIIGNSLQADISGAFKFDRQGIPGDIFTQELRRYIAHPDLYEGVIDTLIDDEADIVDRRLAPSDTRRLYEGYGGGFTLPHNPAISPNIYSVPTAPSGILSYHKIVVFGWYRYDLENDEIGKISDRFFITLKQDNFFPSIIEIVGRLAIGMTRGLFQRKFRFKVDPKQSGGQRRDHLPGYFNIESIGNVTTFIRWLKSITSEIGTDKISKKGPYFAVPLGNGIFYARNPVSEMESFGGLRAKALSIAMKRIRFLESIGATLSVEQKIKIYAYYFNKCGISTIHPAFNREDSPETIVEILRKLVD